MRCAIGWGHSLEDLGFQQHQVGTVSASLQTAQLQPDPAPAAASVESASYVCGTSDVPLLYMTIGTALDRTIASHGEREALVVCHQGVRWTWAELGARVDALAASFIGLGLHAGDRVGIWAPNCVEWVLTQLASAKAGLILVTINPSYRTSELEHALNLSGCRAVVIAEQFKTSDYVAMLLELAPELALEPDGQAARAGACRRLPALELVIQMGSPRCPSFIAFDSLLRDASEEQCQLLRIRSASLQPDDPINVQFTSGTTGAPKGATLTHYNILNNGYFVGRLMRFSERDRLCVPVPLYHCFGMVMGVLNCVAHGAALILPADAFDPAAVLRSVEQERCTALYGVPTMFVAELALPQFGSFDLKTLRTGVMAGAPCPVEVMRRVICDMHMSEVTICYGMTETSPVSFQTRADADIETRVSTVGTVHPFVEVKIVDDAGRVVPRGHGGELLTRGYSVMAGYWNDTERTAEAIDAAGWMHTGDLATLDAEGRCRIIGRLKDMIIRGGENVYPAELENFLFKHPRVIEAAVFGVPDPKFGEEVCAWLKVSGEMSQEEILHYCRGQIAHYKIPKHIRFVSGFPMTVTGKVQKFMMRAAMSKELGIEPPS
jgi:fatty-acyl-CoA synthase